MAKIAKGLLFNDTIQAISATYCDIGDEACENI